MAHMLIRHTVEKFDEWQAGFEDHRAAREKNGLQDLHIWRNADNPSEVIILFKATDLQSARDFARSSDLQAKMLAAGVCCAPDIVFLEEN